MKKIITILLIFSLYSPQIAQFLSYSQCVILVNFNVDVDLCDCLKKSTTPYHAVDGMLNTEAKANTAKADWNYANNHSFNIAVPTKKTPVNKHFSFYNQTLPNAPADLVFRPPC